MNNGTITPTRPSMGAWLSYGLGTENADLPGYVVLCPGRPVRFAELWSAASCPASTRAPTSTTPTSTRRKMIPYLRNATLPPAAQRRQLDLMQRLNEEHLAERGADAALEARIQAMETAFRMQTAATDAFDVRREPAEGARRVRQRPLRQRLPAGPPAGRARRALRAGLLRQRPALGHAPQPQRHDAHSCARTSTSRSPPC